MMAAAAAMPSMAVAERPVLGLEELKLVVSVPLGETLPVALGGMMLVALAEPVAVAEAGRATEGVKTKGFVVGSEASVLPIAVM